MEERYSYSLEKRVFLHNEVFEVSEERMMKIISYDTAVNYMKKVVGARTLKFYDYGDEDKGNGIPFKVDESEAMVRVGLSRFLRRVLGDVTSYSEGKYRIPIKYQGHQDEFKKDFWDYLQDNAKSNFS